MTEEVTPTNEARFLGLDPNQFGTVIFLSSASVQMADHINSEPVRKEMERLISEGKHETIETALAWIRGQRNAVMQLSGASTFVQNLLAQVEDMLVDQLLAVPVTQVVEEKSE